MSILGKLPGLFRKAPTPPEAWEIYISRVSEDLFSVFVNTGFKDVAADWNRAQSILVTVPLGTVSDNGLPTNEEGQRLMAFDSGLDQAIAGLDAAYTGRVTGKGVRKINFAAMGDKAAETLHRSVKAVCDAHGYAPQFQIEPEPGFPFYHDAMYPTDLDWRQINDQKLLESLRDQGDIQTERRNVEHMCFFPTPEQAAKFSAQVDGEGYTTVHTAPADGRVLVRLFHISAMAHSEMTDHAMHLFLRVGEFDGMYDGWETCVVTEAGAGLKEASRVQSNYGLS